MELAKEHPGISFGLIGPIKDKDYFEDMDATKPSNVKLSSVTISKDEVLEKMVLVSVFLKSSSINMCPLK